MDIFFNVRTVLYNVINILLLFLILLYNDINFFLGYSM